MDCASNFSADASPDVFFADLGKIHPRSKSVLGNRSEALEGVHEVAFSEQYRSSSITADGVKFNRKRDRMYFGQDLSKPKPTREFVDGVPLLLDLSKLSTTSLRTL